jgi:hypothetical protein
MRASLPAVSFHDAEVGCTPEKSQDFLGEVVLFPISGTQKSRTQSPFFTSPTGPISAPAPQTTRNLGSGFGCMGLLEEPAAKKNPKQRRTRSKEEPEAKKKKKRRKK